MIQFKPILEVEENLEARAKGGADLPVVLETANTVVSPTIKETVQLLARSAKSVEKRTIFKAVCKSGSDKRDHSRQRPKKGKGKRFHMK